MEPQKEGTQHKSCPPCTESQLSVLISSSNLTPPALDPPRFWIHCPFSIYIFTLPNDLDPPNPSFSYRYCDCLLANNFPVSPSSLNVSQFGYALEASQSSISPFLSYMLMRLPNFQSRKRVRTAEKSHGHLEGAGWCPSFKRGKLTHPTFKGKHPKPPGNRAWVPSYWTFGETLVMPKGVSGGSKELYMCFIKNQVKNQPSSLLSWLSVLPRLLCL